MKPLILGLAAGLMIGTAATAVAASTDTVQALIAHYKIIVSGKEARLSHSPITLNGTTYLPLRDIATITGYTVTFKNGEITLSLPSGTRSPSSTPSAPYTPSAPTVPYVPSAPSR